MEATTRSGPSLSYTLGTAGGILGGIWLIIWPFISWPLGTGLPSIWDRGAAAGILDVIYGVLLILFTVGCMFGWRASLGSFTLGHVSLYGMLVLTIALLVVPFLLGNNPKILGIIPAGSNQDEFAFWNDIITGIISIPFVIYFILPHPSKASVSVDTAAMGASSPSMIASTPSASVTMPSASVSAPAISTPPLNVSAPTMDFSAPPLNVSAPTMDFSAPAMDMSAPSVSTPPASVIAPLPDASAPRVQAPSFTMPSAATPSSSVSNSPSSMNTPPQGTTVQPLTPAAGGVSAGNLEWVDGIGPTDNQILAQHGISSDADLANATVAQLKATGITRESDEEFASWIAQAQHKLGRG
jgi:predicted flap endonuclease-1-like 5' DNA nuclease